MEEQVVAVEESHGCADRLNKFKDGEGWRAVFRVEKTQYAEQLGVEAAVSQTQQKAAEDGNFFAEEKKKK